MSYFFYLYLVLHACAVKFDVMENVKNFAKYFWELNNALIKTTILNKITIYFS